MHHPSPLALEISSEAEQNDLRVCALIHMSVQKNPSAALLFSVIVPGLGQIFNRETKKGFIILASCLGLGLLTYWLSGLNKVSIALALILLWSSAIVDAYKVAKASGQPSDFYYRKPYVVVMLLLVGPLALPLLWQSPHFSRFARWAWTVIVTVAVAMFMATPYLLNSLIKQAAEITGKSESAFCSFSALPSQRSFFIQSS
jgi:hypothetical protein